jgi:CheY-like chemotaxis protein
MTAGAQRAPLLSNPTLSGRVVLVIEDHPDSLQLLETVFHSLRARVVSARSIEEAEQQLSRSRPHLIVCDMRLPDGSGVEFIRWLRAQSPRLGRVPCIAITGWERVFPPERATGFDAYMRKPLDLDRFCDVAVALGGA